MERKTWRDYLLEGLMIFIAVTMGFFAENLRDYFSDKEKEKTYIESLVKNLQQDSVDLSNTIADNRRKIQGLDSIIAVASTDLFARQSKLALYKYSKWVSYYSAFDNNDATIAQLKNAGGLQYIRQGYVADSIARYDEMLAGIYAAEAPYAKSMNDAMEVMSDILVFRIAKDSTFFRNGKYTDRDIPLLTSDKREIELLFNKIFLVRGWTQNYLQSMEMRLPYPSRLAHLLKVEYGID